MQIWASIRAMFSSGEDFEVRGSEEYEDDIVTEIIESFSGFKGVYVVDQNGEVLDPYNLPPHFANDGGADCIIYIDADKYTETGFQWVCTRVDNILEELESEVE